MNSPHPPCLSPFDKLPTEIVEEVFSAACEYLTLPFSYAKSTVPTLLAVSLVCRKWLGIATQHHSLWATFSINPSFWKSGFSSHLGRFLQKSGACPLRIGVWSGESEIVLDVLDVIMSHSERWERIAFDFPLEVQYLRKLDAVQERLPLLRHLEITGSDSDNDPFPAGTQHSTVFSPRSAPSLACISLTKMDASTLRALDLPWNRLARANLDYPSFAQIRSALQLSRSLKTLKVCTFFYWRYAGAIRIPLTRLEPLKELRAYGMEDNIANLICPSLQRLFLPFPKVSNAQKFLDNSPCTLVHIELEEDLFDIRFIKEDTVPILRHPSLENLRSIHLRHLNISNEMVDILTVDTHNMFPLLEILRLEVKFVWGDRPDFESQIEGLQRMVTSRTHAKTHAKYVDEPSHENYTSGITSNLTPFLQEFTLILHVYKHKWSDWEDTKFEELRSVCLSRNMNQTVRVLKHNTWAFSC